jgi:hypothetical protein
MRILICLPCILSLSLSLSQGESIVANIESIVDNNPNINNITSHVSPKEFDRLMIDFHKITLARIEGVEKLNSSFEEILSLWRSIIWNVPAIILSISIAYPPTQPFIRNNFIVLLGPKLEFVWTGLVGTFSVRPIDLQKVWRVIRRQPKSPQSNEAKPEEGGEKKKDRNEAKPKEDVNSNLNSSTVIQLQSIEEVKQLVNEFNISSMEEVDNDPNENNRSFAWNLPEFMGGDPIKINISKTVGQNTIISTKELPNLGAQITLEGIQTGDGIQFNLSFIKDGEVLVKSRYKFQGDDKYQNHQLTIDTPWERSATILSITDEGINFKTAGLNPVTGDCGQAQYNVKNVGDGTYVATAESIEIIDNRVVFVKVSAATCIATDNEISSQQKIINDNFNSLSGSMTPGGNIPQIDEGLNGINP